MKGRSSVGGALDVYGEQRAPRRCCRASVVLPSERFFLRFHPLFLFRRILEWATRYRNCSLLIHRARSLIVVPNPTVVTRPTLTVAKAVSLLQEMQEAGLKPHPAAHQAALSAVAATEGHEATMALLATMKVRDMSSTRRKRALASLCQHPASDVGRLSPVLLCVPALYGG